MVVYIGIIMLNTNKITQYDTQTNLTYCWVEIAVHDRWLFTAIGISVAVLQFITMTGLLSLFVRGLWKLNHQMIVHFLSKHNHMKKSTELGTIPSSSKSMSSSTEKAEDTNVNQVPVLKRPHSKLQVSVSEVLDSWEKQADFEKDQSKVEVERIVTTHNVIKQTVCAAIAISSTIFVDWNCY